MRRFEIDGWLVEPARGRISRGRKVRSIQPRAMDLLLRLVAGEGEVVSREALLEDVWNGRAVVDHVLPKTIGSLRQAFGETARRPRVIRTHPRRGYRIGCEIRVVPEDRPGYRLGSLRPRLAVAALGSLAWVALPVLVGPLLPVSSNHRAPTTPQRVEARVPIEIALEPSLDRSPSEAGLEEAWDWQFEVKIAVDGEG